MRLCIFGAAGRTGAVLVRLALEQGHEVTVFFRKDSNASPPLGARAVWGELSSREDVERAIARTDAVVSLYGRRPLRMPGDFAPAVAAIIDAMKALGIRRLIQVTDMVAGGWTIFDSIYGWLLQARFASAVRDRAEQETLVKGSGQDWTIVMAPRLTTSSGLTREDICTTVLDALDSRRSIGRHLIVR
jgi:uncharacterized protein YbjT (DUF2867 family)